MMHFPYKTLPFIVTFRRWRNASCAVYVPLLADTDAFTAEAKKIIELKTPTLNNLF